MLLLCVWAVDGDVCKRVALLLLSSDFLKLSEKHFIITVVFFSPTAPEDNSIPSHWLCVPVRMRNVRGRSHVKVVLTVSALCVGPGRSGWVRVISGSVLCLVSPGR